jgi:hypothetical protein
MESGYRPPPLTEPERNALMIPPTARNSGTAILIAAGGGSVAFLSEPVKGKPHLRWGGSFASGSESWNSERQLTIMEGDDQKTITDSIGKQKEDILNFLSVLCSFGGQIWLELYYSRNKEW